MQSASVASSASNVDVKFPAVDAHGLKVGAEDWTGLFGANKHYAQTASGPSDLSTIIQAAITAPRLSLDQSDCVRSLLAASFLQTYAKSAKGVDQILSQSIQLPESVQAIAAVGAFGKTLKGTAMLAVSGLFAYHALSALDNPFTVVAGPQGLVMGVDLFALTANDAKLEGILAASDFAQSVFAAIDQRHQKPGQALALDAFSPETLIGCIKAVHLLSLAEKTDATSEFHQVLVGAAKRNLLGLFLSNSRQISGIEVEGKAASSLVSAHAALALGFASVQGHEQILNWLGQECALIQEPARQSEAQSLLKHLNTNVKASSEILAARLDQRGLATLAEEAVDWVNYPLVLSTKVMAIAAYGLGEALPGATGSSFKVLSELFLQTSRLADLTPVVFSQAMSAGLNAKETIGSAVSGVKSGLDAVAAWWQELRVPATTA